MRIKTGNRGLLVTALGRYQVNGNSKWHQLVIVKTKPAAGDNGGVRSKTVAQILVKASDTAKAADGYVWSTLEQPVTLEPLNEYYVASFENGGGDSYLSNGTIGYNANQSQNTDAQKLFDYTGSSPGTITTTGTDFEIAATTYVTNANDQWQSVTGSCKGIVNIRIQ